MTNTPRTDVNCWDITEGRFRDEYTSVVKSGFARELEIENQKMRNLLDQIHKDLSSGKYVNSRGWGLDMIIKIGELIPDELQILDEEDD